MSWAAHEFESYALQKHLGARVSFSAVLVGCFLPDLFTKLPVYGFNFGAFQITHVEEPWKYHRGWPGVGPTHSLLFVALVSVLVLAATRHRGWSLGLLVGGWAHVLTDCFDSAGTMLFFPFTTQHYSFGMWSYAAQEGRYGDASAYYSSLGGMWDLLWLCVCLANWRVFTRRYFVEEVAPWDPVWSWLQRKWRASTIVLLALYRSYFIYGAARVFGWSLWARFVNPMRGSDAVDLSWGGPGWVEAAPQFQRAATWKGFLVQTTIGVAGLSLVLFLLWRFLGRRLWMRAPATVPIPFVDQSGAAVGTVTAATTGQ